MRQYWMIDANMLQGSGLVAMLGQWRSRPKFNTQNHSIGTFAMAASLTIIIICAICHQLWRRHYSKVLDCLCISFLACNHWSELVSCHAIYPWKSDSEKKINLNFCCNPCEENWLTIQFWSKMRQQWKRGESYSEIITNTWVLQQFRQSVSGEENGQAATKKTPAIVSQQDTALFS